MKKIIKITLLLSMFTLTPISAARPPRSQKRNPSNNPTKTRRRTRATAQTPKIATSVPAPPTPVVELPTAPAPTTWQQRARDRAQTTAQWIKEHPKTSAAIGVGAAAGAAGLAYVSRKGQKKVMQHINKIKTPDEFERVANNVIGQLVANHTLVGFKPLISQLATNVDDGKFDKVVELKGKINRGIEKDKKEYTKKEPQLTRDILRLTEAAMRITEIYKDDYKEPNEFKDTLNAALSDDEEMPPSDEFQDAHSDDEEMPPWDEDED